MWRWVQAVVLAAGLSLPGGTYLLTATPDTQPLESRPAVEQPSIEQPIIDLHRHAPWPGDSDAEGLALIREEMERHNVVLAALFVTGREDLALYPSNEAVRFILSPMFPCPALTADRKWCFTDTDGLMPDG